MAELMLHEGPQLAKRLVILGNPEKRVVAEPVRSPRLVDDSAAATGLDFGPNGSRGIGQRQRTDERGPAPLVGHVGERFEQLAVVGLVVAVLAGIAGGEHSRSASERID